MTEKAPTHIAHALRKESRQQSRYIEIGHARIEKDGEIHHVFLDRLPVGGFTGHVFLSPVGAKLPDPEPQPDRPGETN
jgi:hypothetical protein